MLVWARPRKRGNRKRGKEANKVKSNTEWVSISKTARSLWVKAGRWDGTTGPGLSVVQCGKGYLFSKELWCLANSWHIWRGKEVSTSKNKQSGIARHVKTCKKDIISCTRVFALDFYCASPANVVTVLKSLQIDGPENVQIGGDPVMFPADAAICMVLV